MSELQEKREYYPDRSLKSVYFVDKQGRKQGNYTKYEQNSDKTLYRLEYKDDAVWNGKVNTDNGYIIYNDGEKSKEVKLTSQRYDYSSGKLKREKGSGKDFPFVDFVEKETIENGESFKEREFCYESLENNEGPHSHNRNWGHFCIYTHKLRHQTSYKNGVRVDKIEKITARTAGWEEDGWNDRVAWSCIFNNGELTEYSDEKGYHASFEKGVPIGDYKMPLNKDKLAFNYSPCALTTGDDLIDKISIPMIDGAKVFNFGDNNIKVSDSVVNNINECFKRDIVAEGTWVGGKFTGEALSNQRDWWGSFSASWNNGAMSACLSMREEPYYTITLQKLNWNDNKCSYYKEENNTCRGIKTIEEYSMKNGKKDGLYKKLYKDSRRTMRGWIDRDVPIEEAEYKEGNLHGTHKKYNVREKESAGYGEEKYTSWLDSETQYKDGQKHGFEKLYNSDGTVAETKYWQNGEDCTVRYNRLKEIAAEEEKQRVVFHNRLKKIAAKHINEEDKLSEGKEKRVILRKKSKLDKTMELVKETLKDNLHLK